MTRSGSEQFVRVTAALLQAAAQDTAAAIADAAQVPHPTTHRILRFYRYHGAVAAGRGPLKPDKRKVFHLATGLRRDRAVPDLVLRHAPGPAAAVADLKAAGIPFVVAFASAANLLAYFEPPAHASLLIRRDDAARIRTLLGRRKGPGRVHLYYRDLETIPTVSRQGVRVTEPFRTLLDAGADASAGAHAEFLYQALVERGR